MGEGKSRLRRTISSWANSDRPARARPAHDPRGRRAAARSPRPRTASASGLQGTLRTVTLSRAAGCPALEAELFDGSGVLTLIWLGRRRITGIAPGRSIQVEGRIGVHDRTRVMFNPRYELKAVNR